MSESTLQTLGSRRGGELTHLGAVAYGFAIWAVATIAFRLFGHVFFHPEQAWIAAGLAVVALPLIAGLTLVGFMLMRTPPRDRPAAASLFAVTGMFLDAIAVFAWDTTYPNMLPEQAGPFAAFMLWCNAIALATGVLAARGSHRMEG
jgi:hypothetical protein